LPKTPKTPPAEEEAPVEEAALAVEVVEEPAVIEESAAADAPAEEPVAEADEPAAEAPAEPEQAAEKPKRRTLRRKKDDS
jgi:hypothetical protein